MNALLIDKETANGKIKKIKKIPPPMDPTCMGQICLHISPMTFARADNRLNNEWMIY